MAHDEDTNHLDHDDDTQSQSFIVRWGIRLFTTGATILLLYKIHVLYGFDKIADNVAHGVGYAIVAFIAAAWILFFARMCWPLFRLVLLFVAGIVLIFYIGVT